jgi:hypothetical protein
MKFTSFRQAMDFLYDERNEDSPEYPEAMVYAVENAPPELQAKMKAALFEIFPELVPSHIDEKTGDMYFSTETIRNITGMSRKEMDKKVDELKAQGHARVVNEDELTRVQ